MLTINYSYSLYLLLNIFIPLVYSGVINENYEIEDQGLYKSSDKVTILNADNIKGKLQKNNYAYLVQFYNTYCGHCREFSHVFKKFSLEVNKWKRVIHIGVIDCSQEDNTSTCAEFEITAYPTLLYFREELVTNVVTSGSKINAARTVDELKTNLIMKMQSEQLSGFLRIVSPLNFYDYSTIDILVYEIPPNILYTFLVFETQNSTIGAELILEVKENDFVIKRLDDTSLARQLGIHKIPALAVIGPTRKQFILKPKDSFKNSFLEALQNFLKMDDYQFPATETTVHPTTVVNMVNIDYNITTNHTVNSDIVFYNDLELTIRTSLRTEISRLKYLEGESLQAFLNYLDALLNSFTFRYHFKEYISSLKDTVVISNKWNGTELHDKIKSLEVTLAPVYSNNLEYVSCKGSQSIIYRGYTCGLWLLFHSLTINAAEQQKGNGPKVLKAIHGYVKHFFGCTECSEHFQSMADEMKMFDVNNDEAAAIWLWMAHNKVNLRLANTKTEDPEFPKIQFPSRWRCPSCRSSTGDWKLSEVYRYLQSTYGWNHIMEKKQNESLTIEQNPFSSTDIGLISLLE